MKVMEGVSWDFSDRHATKITTQRKMTVPRIPKTGHVAKAVSMRLGDAISGCFRRIRKLYFSVSELESWRVRRNLCPLFVVGTTASETLTVCDVDHELTVKVEAEGQRRNCIEFSARIG
jgi:hypothetical protein